MATYAIGDLHGCFETLQLLLAQLPFDSRRDRLWLVGDLVNRGPRSLETLRWAKRLHLEMAGRMTVVLGNHDLHLLAVGHGITETRNGDTLDEVLSAPDQSELLSWLRHRPLLHREQKHLLVHAGLLPRWSPSEAADLARRLEIALAGEDLQWLLKRNETPRDPDRAQLRVALEGLTRLRTCTLEGKPCRFAGPPQEAPPRCLPWFAVPNRRSREATIVCGHWAALGLRLQPGLCALDSGVVWGHSLSALRLEDLKLYQQRAVEKRDPS
ncbi:MAG: symmetrical bis(5'-nucleosyl)-tetraphosphatase [Deltaproteobacteria bacterium]|nr:symmetrical bis(5'-nucleosyl)-tetraphosphatase [Deltaproteobacteria bacterium]